MVFGTSIGLIKYDGIKRLKYFSFREGLPGVDAEIWGLTIDKKQLLGRGDRS
jgi:hypothetical protein